MSMINYPLTIDTCRQNAFKTVLAQQFDSHSRTMVITLQEDNEQFVADSSMTAVLYVTDEEHTEYPPLACSINEDGTVNVPISSLILTQRSGIYECSLVIFNRDSERLGTFPFSLDVQAGSTVPVDTFSDESVELLTTLIGRTTGAIEDTIQATAAANSAAERAEQAAEQLDVDLAEIHQEIDDTNTRIDNLDANQIAFEDSTDPDVELVSDALIKYANEIANLISRVGVTEDDIDALELQVHNIEGRFNGVQYKSERVVSVSQASDNDHYPTAKAVYDAVKVKADSSSLIPIMNALNTKENVANKVQEITDEQGTSDYPSVPAVIDYVDGELENVQLKSEKVTEVNERSTNNTYPSSKAVYDAIQASGGASAMMVTFTITGIDGSGNYTGVADKTYTEMSDALTSGEVVRGQIALGNDNYISYSVMKGENNIRFFTAAFDINFSLVVEYSESGGEEQVATFTVYAFNIADAGTVSSLVTAVGNLWDVSRYVLQGTTAWNSKTMYKFQSSIFGQGVNTITVQFFSANENKMYLRNLRDGTYKELYVSAIADALTADGQPNTVTTLSNKNSVTFEFTGAGKSLVYDLADDTVKVVGLALADSQICLISRPSVNSAYGLFCDMAHSTGNQSSAITIPT